MKKVNHDIFIAQQFANSDEKTDAAVSVPG